MKRLKLIVPLLFLFLSGCIRVDESMRLFFPKELKELQFVQTQFSAFWWNFIIIENDPDLRTATKICDQLKMHTEKELRMVFCGSGLSNNQDLLASWSADYVFREKFDRLNKTSYDSRLSAAAVQASFVTDQKLFLTLRSDPFQTWQDFLTLSKNSMFDSYEKRKGFLYDPTTQRSIIPIQFQLKPELIHIQPIMSLLQNYPEAFLIGSHGATYRNEKRIRDDLGIVSVISLSVFILFMIFLVFKSRLTALFLIVPVSAAIYGAALIVQLIDGSVHGLTLAFGSCIVGLTLDYGLHGAFGSESERTWISNSIGLLTTLSGICILILSGIPLISQMMIFSGIGLVLGFLFFYFLFKYFKIFLKIKNIDFIAPQMWGASWVVLILVLFGFYGAYTTKFSMDLRELSFVSDRESDLTSWFFSKNQGEDSFLLIQPMTEVSRELVSEKNWSDVHGIGYEGVAKYFKNFNESNENLNSWTTDGCKYLKNLKDSDVRRLFSPFVDSICALGTTAIQIQSFDQLKQRPYLQHLFGDEHVLTIFTAKNEAQSQLIQTQYPKTKSLAKGIKNFSISLEQDLLWMIPVSLLMSCVILGLYYRNTRAVLTSLLPFATGVGFYFLASLFFNFTIDLVSVLGLVMVFGFSIDYGVFSTDVHHHHGTEAEIKSVYSALTFAALTNVLGFFPMLFAGHPVLARLGAALFCGTVGAYLGTVYGVYPYYMKLLKKYEPTV